jgi:hypothetical protein
MKEESILFTLALSACPSVCLCVGAPASIYLGREEKHEEKMGRKKERKTDRKLTTRGRSLRNEQKRPRVMLYRKKKELHWNKKNKKPFARTLLSSSVVCSYVCAPCVRACVRARVCGVRTSSSASAILRLYPWVDFVFIVSIDICCIYIYIYIHIIYTH